MSVWFTSTSRPLYYRSVSLFFSVIIFTGCAGFPQETRKASSWIESLSWGSLCGDEKAYRFIYPCGEAVRKIFSDIEEATPELIRKLNDPEHAVPIHLILTHAYYPEKIQTQVRWLYDQANEKPVIVGTMITVNNLTWKHSIPTQEYSVSSAECEKIKALWNQQLKDGVLIVRSRVPIE